MDFFRRNLCHSLWNRYADAPFPGRRFFSEYLEMAAAVQSQEYYVNMMIAWYFATALAKQWDATVPYIEQHKIIRLGTQKDRSEGRGKLPDHTGTEGISERISIKRQS